jgi:threonine synthase
MDIQVSSNFERLLYLANDNDATKVVRAFDTLSQSGAFTLETPALASIRAEFDSGAADEAVTAATIRQQRQATGELLDPHTAVGVAVALQHLGHCPMVTLATAHPAKFPDAVEQATGVRPALPPHLKHLLDAQESFTVLPNSPEAVKQFLKERVSG